MTKINQITDEINHLISTKLINNPIPNYVQSQILDWENQIPIIAYVSKLTYAMSRESIKLQL